MPQCPSGSTTVLMDDLSVGYRNLRQRRCIHETEIADSREKLGSEHIVDHQMNELRWQNRIHHCDLKKNTNFLFLSMLITVTSLIIF